MPNDRLRQVFWAAKSNLALDATLTPADLVLLLGCSPDRIYTCKQPANPTPNLNIIQIYDLGRLGMQRGAEQQRRAQAVIAALKQQDSTTQVITFKKFAEPGQGIWWGDSRGSNDFIGSHQLVLEGTPCPNLATLQYEPSCDSGSGSGVRDDQAIGDRGSLYARSGLCIVTVDCSTIKLIIISTLPSLGLRPGLFMGRLTLVTVCGRLDHDWRQWLSRFYRGIVTTIVLPYH